MDDDVDHESLLDEYFNNATRDSPDIREHYRPLDRLVYMGGIAFCYLYMLRELYKDKLCHASGRKKIFGRPLLAKWMAGRCSWISMRRWRHMVDSRIWDCRKL